MHHFANSNMLTSSIIWNLAFRLSQRPTLACSASFSSTLCAIQIYLLAYLLVWLFVAIEMWRKCLRDKVGGGGTRRRWSTRRFNCQPDQRKSPIETNNPRIYRKNTLHAPHYASASNQYINHSTASATICRRRPAVMGRLNWTLGLKLNESSHGILFSSSFGQFWCCLHVHKTKTRASFSESFS